ncbi:MAG: flagellar hook-basal body complex protein FliE [Kofleriaceae bacterium]
MSVTAIEQIRGFTGVETTKKPGGSTDTDLGQAFGKALADAKGLETKATDAAERFAQGDPSMGIHEVVIASEQANIAVRYATTLKNKAVDAYRELMNTQV